MKASLVKRKITLFTRSAIRGSMEMLQQMADKVEDVINTLTEIKESGQPRPFLPQAALQMHDFSGDWNDIDSNINEFETNYKTMGNAVGWSIQQQAQILPLYLKGHAKEVYHRLSEAQKESLDDIFDALRETFLAEEAAAFITMQLRTRTQNKGESVAKYAADIKRLTRLAFYNQGDKVMESSALQAFVAGLLTELKREVVRRSPKTIDEAIMIAAKEEMTQKIMDHDKKESTKITDELTEKLAGLMATINNINTSQATAQLPNQSRYNPRPLAEWHYTAVPKCYNCGRRGHIARICKDRPQYNNRSRRYPRTYQRPFHQNRIVSNQQEHQYRNNHDNNGTHSNYFYARQTPNPQTPPRRQTINALLNTETGQRQLSDGQKEREDEELIQFINEEDNGRYIIAFAQEVMNGLNALN